MEEKFVTQTFVAVQPDGLDPCELRIQRGSEAVRDLIAARIPLYEFAIRNEISKYNVGQFDANTVESRLTALDAAAELIARIKDDALRKIYAGLVDRWLGLMDEQLMLQRVNERLIGGRRGKVALTEPSRRARADGETSSQGTHLNGTTSMQEVRDPIVNVERQALKLAIQRPALCGPAFDELPSAVFTIPAHAAVCDLIAANGGVASAGSAREWSERLRAAAPNDNARSFVTRLAVESLEVPGEAGEPDARFAEAVLARVEELSVSRDIARVKSRLQRMSPVTEQAEYNRMFGDLVALEQRKKVLSDRAAGAL